MKVVYTAPNRAHHYKYAAALNVAGCLYAFVSGFPRLSPQATSQDLKGRLYHADVIQTLYVASLRGKIHVGISSYLAYLSKIEQDMACQMFVRDCDIFLYYNGSGLRSSRLGKKHGVINIVEAVNSHVEYQEKILEEEYHTLNLPWRPFPKNEKERRLIEYEEADYILLPSEFVKRSFIEKGFPEEKLLKVPYGFTNPVKSEISPTPLNKTKGFTILYVGTISIRKGIRYLIDAFNKLDVKFKRLIIVGPDANDGALTGVYLDSSVSFTGVLKDQQLVEAYKAADVFCLPSIEDGFGLVLGEALSFGLPIITTCNTGADDIITDGKEGYIVPIRDSKSIQTKLQNLADDPKLLAQIAYNSRLKAGKLNGWEECGINLVETLKKVHFRKQNVK